MRTTNSINHTILNALLLSLAVLFFVGCHKNPVSNNDNGKGQMTVVVNGTRWTATLAMVLVHDRAPKPFLSFQGIFEKDGKLQMQILLTTDQRNFKSGDKIVYPYTGADSVEYQAICQFPAQADSGMYTSLTGEMTITAYEGMGGRAKGNFWFIGLNIYGDTLNVQQGSFDMPIRQSPTM